MADASGEARTITLGRGLPAQRTFRVVTVRTMAQDIWLTRTVRKAGLDQVNVPTNAAKDDAVFQQFLTSLVERVFAADVVGDLLAGVLVPVGVPRWTTAHAEETKMLVLDLVDDEEKKGLLSLLAEILQHFLSSGRSS